MKKLILFTTLLLTLFSCGKDKNDTDKFNAEGEKVLNVLKGKWKSENKYDPEELSFIPYTRKKELKSSQGIIGYFHGDAIRRFTLLGKQEVWYMYFYVDTGKNEIHLCEVDKDGKFSIVQTKQYDYEVINNNRIRLHDKSLSWLLVDNYERVE